VLAARDLGIPRVLEVNAPIIDFPRFRKSRIDRALVIEPMRRWRDRLCRLTSLFVTPSAHICRSGSTRDPCSKLNGAPTSITSGPTRRRSAIAARRPSRVVRVCRRVQILARRDPSVGRARSAPFATGTRGSAVCSSVTA
jgi:hypothetical protein